MKYMDNKKIYYITGTNFNIKLLEEICSNGIDVVQYRRKDTSTKVMIEEATLIKEITDEYNIPLIINDRLDVMLAVDADGVHLGNSDMSIKTARKIAKDIVIGATAKTVKDAKELEKQGADYLGVGAMYPSSTKVDAIVTPVEILNEIAENVNIPVYAIGGLSAENITNEIIENIEGVCFSSYLEQTDTIVKIKKIQKKI